MRQELRELLERYIGDCENLEQRIDKRLDEAEPEKPEDFQKLIRVRAVVMNEKLKAARLAFEEEAQRREKPVIELVSALEANAGIWENEI